MEVIVVRSGIANTKTLLSPNDSPTAEREQVRKIHNMNFRHFDILLFSCCEFFGLVPFLQLAIQIGK
jgi:hypothetical protein